MAALKIFFASFIYCFYFGLIESFNVRTVHTAVRCLSNKSICISCFKKYLFKGMIFGVMHLIMARKGTTEQIVTVRYIQFVIKNAKNGLY